MSTPYITLLPLLKWFSYQECFVTASFHSFSSFPDWPDWNNSTLAYDLVCFKHPITSFFVQTRHTVSFLVRHCYRKHCKALCEPEILDSSMCLLVSLYVGGKDKPGTKWFWPRGAVYRLLQRTPRNRVTVTVSTTQRQRDKLSDKLPCDAWMAHLCDGVHIHVYTCRHAAWGSVAWLVCVG